MKDQSRAWRADGHSLCAALLVTLAGCFEDPPPTTAGTSSGGTSDGAPGPTTGSTTGTSIDPSTSASVSASSGDIGSAEADSVADESSTAPEVLCGNAIVDDGEMCDGTAGCDPACEFTDYACNPLNDAGCIAPLRCGLFDFAAETFACMPAGLGGVGNECGRSKANDGDCGASLTCLFNPQTVLCDVGNCCVRYCDLTEGDSGCEAFELCAQFFPNPTFVGLEHLGFCFSR